MSIRMQEIKSSQIHSIGHDGNTTLAVQFHNGGLYHYHGVPRSVHDELLTSKSAGSYLHQNVKGQYKHTKVE